MNKPFFRLPVTFNGTTYESSGDVSTFKFLHGAETLFKFTISFWIRAIVPEGERQCILDTSCALSKNVGITVSIDNGLGKRFSRCLFCYIVREENAKPVVDIIANKAYPNDDEWHKVIITYDHYPKKNNGKLYIDGVLKVQVTKTGDPPSKRNSKVPLSIGCVGDGSMPFVGELKDFSIYKDICLEE